MRNLAIAVVLVGSAGSAQAGPIGVVSTIGGWDSSAPGHRDDGFVGGLGYQLDRVAALVQYKQLGSGDGDYSGGAQGVDVVLQARLFTFHNAGQPAHIDANLIVGQQWVTWHRSPQGLGVLGLIPQPDTTYSGREAGVGISANFFFRFTLEYLVFNDGIEAGTGIACRGTCTMPSQAAVHGDDHAVMLEIGMIFGDR